VPWPPELIPHAVTLPGKSEIAVAAGILTDSRGRALIAQRPHGAHQGGWWEFPGGKLDATESPLEGLVRELREEIGVEVHAAEPLMSYRHEYPERFIHLHVWRVTEFSGEPAGMEGQALRWSAVEDLPNAGLLPADLPIVMALLDSAAQV